MFNRISHLLKWGVARFSDSTGARLVRPDGTAVGYPATYSPSDFRPTILASLVAGATASRSGNTVTVAATGHGVVGSNSKNGYRIYFPGSPSIPAGFYDGFVWISADSFTFQTASSGTVSSELINGGAAFVSAVDFAQMTVSAGMLRAGSRVAAVVSRLSDVTASLKSVGISYGGSPVSYVSLVSGPNAISQRIGFVVPVASKQIGFTLHENTTSNSSQITRSINTAVDNQLTIYGQVSAAGSYIVIDSAAFEVVS